MRSTEYRVLQAELRLWRMHYTSWFSFHSEVFFTIGDMVPPEIASVLMVRPEIKSIAPISAVESRCIFNKLLLNCESLCESSIRSNPQDGAVQLLCQRVDSDTIDPSLLRFGSQPFL